jgi:tRNA nucleotidyltransferase/poly(A) polymerase
MQLEALDIIKSQKGILKLKELGGEIFLVGGCVRDHFLGKESKDIDIIVRLLDDLSIISTLKEFGFVDRVGESFGVIKFTPFGWTGEPIDIAQPRVDVLIDKTKGHHGIQAKFDPFITIEKDLERRDFTINSMAVSWDGTLIDPFNGLNDLKNKIIRATSSKAFAEDPLRMCRAVQFSARFKFVIEDITWKMILDNKSDIKSISGERITEELDKIFFKGDIQWGLKVFKESGLHGELFKSSMMCDFVSKIRTREDFFFTICADGDTFKSVLKGDVKTTKGIKALQKCFELKFPSSKVDVRQKLFDAIQISETVLESEKLPFFVKDSISEFRSGKLPKSFKELALNGDDLMALGFQGVEVGKRQKFLLNEIFSERRLNTKEDLILN